MNGRKTIWNQDRVLVEEKLMQCIKLNQGYKDAYIKVKNRKVGREIREFSFSEKYIFGRFDAFCTRLRNLLSMFKKVNLFTRLFNERMEALLPEEALEEEKGEEVNDEVFEERKAATSLVLANKRQRTEDSKSLMVRVDANGVRRLSSLDAPIMCCEGHASEVRNHYFYFYLFSFAIAIRNHFQNRQN